MNTSSEETAPGSVRVFAPAAAHQYFLQPCDTNWWLSAMDSALGYDPGKRVFVNGQAHAMSHWLPIISSWFELMRVFRCHNMEVPWS